LVRAVHADRADRQLRLLVGFALSLGAATIGYSVVEVVRQGIEAVPPVSNLVAVGLLVAVGDSLNVRVRVRSTHHAMMWTDAAVLIGLAMLPTTWVVLLTAGGVALSKTRRRVVPIRSAFGAPRGRIGCPHRSL
jgi:hypothetical protein